MTKTMQDKSSTIVRKGTVPLTSTKNVDNPAEQANLEMDPKGLSSFRGKGVYIGKGYTADVKGTRRMLKSKNKTATWF